MKVMIIASILLHGFVGVLLVAGQPTLQPSETANEQYFRAAQKEIEDWAHRDDQDADDSTYGYLAGAIYTVKEDLYWCGMDWKTEKFDGDIDKLKADWKNMQEVDRQVHSYRFS